MDIKKEPEDIEIDSNEQTEDCTYNNNSTDQQYIDDNQPHDVFIKQEVVDSQTGVNFKEEAVYIKSEFNSHSELDVIDNTYRQDDIKSELSMITTLDNNNTTENFSVDLSKIKRERVPCRSKSIEKDIQRGLIVIKQEKNDDDDGECSHSEPKLTNQTISIEVPPPGAHSNPDAAEKPFRCEKCTYRSSRLGDLKRHALTHSESYLYCADCAYKTKNSRDLKTHRLIHSDRAPLKCEQCPFKSFVACRMKAHRSVHTAEKPYKCDHCAYTCTQSGSLKTHRRIHTGEKPYKCSDCEYRCRKSSHLKVHLSVHAVEKPFRCDVCAYKCKHSGSLKTHRMIHTGEKPHSCDQCAYKCKLIAHLRVHKLTHTNKKPFQCGFCEYACNQAGSLKNHMKIHVN